ncbi:MAG: tripartite tricarboxylate transporter substrate binding protein [Polaromonas sp.]
MAQAWPAKPLRIIVVYPPGGVSDATARAIGEKLAVLLGTRVVIENRAGAGGTIGMEALAKSAPDGYTIGFSAISPVALTPHLGKLNYDAAHDIAPVVSVMYTPVLVVGTPAFTGRDFRDMIAMAQARPGSLRWATSGSATVGHLVLEQIKASSGVNITHIPYKGGGQQLTDALGGNFEILSSNVGVTQLQHVRAGKFKALAVGSPARLDVLPDVPTLAELGFPSANLTSLFGIFAPAKTPAALIQRLNADINKVLQMPDIRQRLVDADNIPTGGSPADFARQIAIDSDSNARIIKAANIKAE